MAQQAPVILKLPSKYASTEPKVTGGSPNPSIEWLTGTWTVTHSTLLMWRAAKNVRITYKPLPARADGKARIDDLVQYEPTSKTGVLKTVEGVDTQASDGGWDWRGKGLLCFVTSHWELLGWGEVTTAAGKTERWAVTWFAHTLFTKEGIDVYCDCADGLSEETYVRVQEALTALEADRIIDMVSKDMRPVEIKLPWVRR